MERGRTKMTQASSGARFGAQATRGGEIVLRSRGQRLIFAAGLLAPALLLIVVSLLALM